MSAVSGTSLALPVFVRSVTWPLYCPRFTRITPCSGSRSSHRSAPASVETATRKLVPGTYDSYAGAPMTSTTPTPHDAAQHKVLAAQEKSLLEPPSAVGAAKKTKRGKAHA